MAGFTMVELVMTIVLVGVLAVVAWPKMSISEYRAIEFRDKVTGALRHAQKTATSHRRMVCVVFTASSVALTIDHDKSGACDGQALNIPGSTSNVVQSSDAVNTVFAVADPSTLNFNFQPDGTGADRSIEIAGQPAMTIVVVGATGYVK